MRIARIIIALLIAGVPISGAEPVGSCADHALDVCTNYVSGYSVQQAASSCKRWASGMFSAGVCSSAQVVGRCKTARQGQIIETLHYSITGRWTAERAGNACQRAGGQFTAE